MEEEGNKIIYESTSDDEVSGSSFEGEEGDEAEEGVEGEVATEGGAEAPKAEGETPKPE